MIIYSFNDDFSFYEFHSLVFSAVDEAPEQVSASGDCTIPEEREEKQQESNTEIKITVKEEEEELVNSKQNAFIRDY